MDAGGEHGNIDSEVCYEDPLIYPLPNLELGHVEFEIWEKSRGAVSAHRVGLG